jgi:transcriptional regulator with XRE-family HTH domain
VSDASEYVDAESLAGKQLRRIRLDRGWTQQDVAERMRPFGYNWLKSTVNRIEGGKRALRVNELEDLARMLGLPREMLLTPLSTDTPIDANGQPMDLGAATAKDLKDAINQRRAERAAAEAEEQDAKDELEELEPRVKAARKRRDHAAAHMAALDKQIGVLWNILQSREHK